VDRDVRGVLLMVYMLPTRWKCQYSGNHVHNGCTNIMDYITNDERRVDDELWERSHSPTRVDLSIVLDWYIDNI